MKILLVVVFISVISGLIWFNYTPSSMPQVSEPTELPVISRLDILHASDLVEGVKLAVAEDDLNAINDWLKKALDLAQAAELSKDDIDYLQSDNARKYVIFHAKRRLFSEAVEQAYYDLYDIESIKAQYPEALNLFEDADKLIADRNKLIQQIAVELAQSEPVNDDILQQAQHHWRQRFAATTIRPTGSK